MSRSKFVVLAAFGLFGLVFLAFDHSPVTVKGRSFAAVPSSPTGVNASDGDYVNKIGVMWNAVRGATTYRVFRSTSNDPNTATEIGSTAANYFFDTTAATSTNYFYWVRAENSSGNSELSSADQGLRANGVIVPGPQVPLEPPVSPTANPVTAAKATLGKVLFWDEQLSSTRTVSCGTCHRPAEGGSDPRTVIGDIMARNPGPDGILNTDDDIFGSPGVPRSNASGNYIGAPIFGLRPQVTNRKSPTYLNTAYEPIGLFWDGRAENIFRDPLSNAVILNDRGSLESQSVGPPLSPVEMAHNGRDWVDAAARMNGVKPLALAWNIPQSLQEWIGGRTYPELFEEAFGTPEVTPARIALAIATHERTLFSDRTPFDRWAAQIEPLTPQEESGRQVFINNQCAACHDGALMTDHIFHNIGVRPTADDPGRGAVTQNPEDNGKFRTPILRNVELRGPYMHNGRFATLEDVVAFYNRGGDHNAPNIDRQLIRPLGLSPQQQADLVAFLKRPLTDVRVRDELPPFDRPKLYTESNRVPVISGTGRAGTGGLTPNAVAIEPPLLGNPSFTVAVGQSLASSSATLVIASADPGVGSSIPASGDFHRSTVTLNPAGQGSVSIAIPNTPSLIGRTFYGRWYVVDPVAANGFAVSRLFTFTIFGEAQAKPAFMDFDGDRRTDVSIFRPGLGEWWIQRSSNESTVAFQFGQGTDKLVPADFTGDGKTDVGLWRESTGQWFILRSEDLSFYAFPFGTAGDIPAPGDFDGDGKADPALFRPSAGLWFIQLSSGGFRTENFGLPGDKPIVADYDNDGSSDIAIFRANGPFGAEWWINRSSSGVIAFQFGLSTDKAVPADYTGDGKADIALWRPSNGFWYVLRSEDFSYYAFPFGLNGDIPVAGDYDGDGKADPAVFRTSQSIWYINRSSGGLGVVPFGLSGDAPLPAAYIP
ncbi:cytochrome c peroxidase [Leptolyngbya sp. 7M]|uniref:cytochrome c peroxidase n=1 Tax=Leptolyngbya sp. 7M TaxID=2812896 RepID=UPI001B8C147F|nr:cytochrome c peroxidase [Leptolyngbya sp. 7M]QYO66775.1 c-type cytochrome [Leptolyngbya sp. 7M]